MQHPGVVVQRWPVPPHGHDFNQHIEHSIGVTKGGITRAFRKHTGSVTDFSHAEVQRLAVQGSLKYDAISWNLNTFRLVQCMRLVATRRDQKITVYKRERRKRGNATQGEPEGQPKLKAFVRRGTNGNYGPSGFS